MKFVCHQASRGVGFVWTRTRVFRLLICHWRLKTAPSDIELQKKDRQYAETKSTHPLRMSSLTSYLPPSDGFLPKWLLFVRPSPSTKQTLQLNQVNPNNNNHHHRSPSSPLATAFKPTSPSPAPSKSTPAPRPRASLPSAPAPSAPGPLSAPSSACTARTTLTTRPCTRSRFGLSAWHLRTSRSSGWFMALRSWGGGLRDRWL
jgi:hypothetical protein